MSNPLREIIFVVDDSQVARKITKEQLSVDYEVHTFSSGQKMFATIRNIIPNLILLDIEMPGANGFTVIQLLKANESTAHIPVIFLTAANNDKSELKALDFGASDYIVKPFFGDILKLRVGLHIDLQRREQQLQDALFSAETTSQSKSSFIAILSHEMRTPLNAIIGFSDLTLDSPNLTREAATNLQNIRHAGSTLLGIISDLLDISKMEAGKFELFPTVYEVADMINNAVTQSILHKKDKPVSFSLEIDENFPSKVRGDELRSKQILTNLLSNAFKYTNEGTVSLSIDCKVEGDDILIIAKVSDTGIGIKKESLGKIFDDYTRAETSAHRSIVGTGLGLSVARGFAKLMDGDITVESESGKGSTFTAVVRQRCTPCDPISPETVFLLKNMMYTTHKQQMNTTLPKLSLPYVRVLVVDDIPTNLTVAAGMLKPYDIVTKCVESGLDAIDAMKNDTVHYDAIFMDHMMPGMDGIEATLQIRALDSDYAKNIPIIAFTANALAGSEDLFLRNGFQGYVPKPINRLQLDSVIRKWLMAKNEENAAKTGAPKKKQKKSAANKSDNLKLSLATCHVDGINFADGLAHFDHDADTYLGVLRTFVKNLPTMLAKAEAVTEEGLPEYTVTVHGMKGSFYGVFAEKAAGMAKDLENASVVGDYDFVTTNNAPFVQYVRKIMDDLTEVVSRLDAAKKKKHKSAPNRRMLDRLLNACKNHAITEIDDIVTQLDSFTYHFGGDLVVWIRDMAEQMNYATIAERLESLK